ncbi:TPA: DUF1642 domain-containing protein [Streptococcus pyogenes]|nr:DUF1642 domain-containing protein [Streptococcus pyogenes]
MNIEEAKRKLHNMAFRDLNTKPDKLRLQDVYAILDQLDQPKPVVPKFVAEWIETCDMRFANLNYVFGENCPEKVKEWASIYGNHEKMLQALLYGYTIEKEKLYTVEIPNPNREGRGHAKFVLERQGNKVFLVKRKSKDCYYNKNSNHLTEQEIRKDFEWAWQQKFAKEVTE